jgi:hypothetical protein
MKEKKFLPKNTDANSWYVSNLSKSSTTDLYKILVKKNVSGFPFIALEWAEEIIFHTKKSSSHHKEKESNVKHMSKAVIKK